MNYLLDTHTFLFAAFDDTKLSTKSKRIIQHEENGIYVSVISFWEISLKYALDKLHLKHTTPEALPFAAEDMGFSILSFDTEDAATYHLLQPTAHKDPFDRMLIRQAMRRNMPVISKDSEYKQYGKFGLTIVW